MEQKFTEMTDHRIIMHDNNGPELRIINDKTGEVMFKNLTDQECMDIAYYFQKVLRIQF